MPEPKQTFSNQVKVKIDDVELIQSLASRLGACWVESSVNLPTAFHLTFRDANQKLLEDFGVILRLGAPVEVYAIADQQGENTPLVRGSITGIETDFDGRTTTTVIRGLDHASKMMRRRRTKGYPEMTATEIVRLLALEDGVMLSPQIESSLERYSLITQPNISDWQFVGELAQRSGMFADFDNLGLLRFRKLKRAIEDLDAGTMPTVLKVGTNVRRCRTGITAADQVDEVTVRGWDVEANVELKATAPALGYRGRAIEANPIDALKGTDMLTYVETGTPYGSAVEVEQAAASLAEDISSVFAELEILADGNPDLVSGKPVRLEDAGKPFDGFYTVTTARHEFGADNSYRTWVSVTGRQVRNVYGLASGASGPTTRIHGVVNAIVDDINDGTKEGRVKVRFPWLDDTYKTRWARTLQFGGRGGGVISPAIGDEVLVAFDRGDVNYPYVLGGLYGHSLNQPSEHDVDLVSAGHLNRQSLVSRAGHRLELLDAPTSKNGIALEGVRLQSGDKMLTLFLDEHRSEIRISSETIVEHVKGPVETATISISRDGKVTVSGKSEVSVTSDASVSVKAPSVSIEGEVSIKGALNVTGALNVAGALNQEGPAASFKNLTFSVVSAGVNSLTGAENVVTPFPI